MTSRENVGRNDPCPCGSGRKYKQCHIDKPFEDEVEQAKADMKIPIVLAVLALIAGIAVGVARGEPGSGAIVVIAGLLGVGGYTVLRKPPGPNEHGGDPGSINFGR